MGSRQGVPRHAFKGDPLLNILARSYQIAFKRAESADPIVARHARVELCAFFSRQNLNRLYRQGFISWKPGEQ